MKNLSYKTVLKYAAVFACFYLGFNAVSGVPSGIAFLPAFLCEGFSFAGVFFVFSLAGILGCGFARGAALCVSAAFLCAVYFIYKKKKKSAGFEQFLYMAISVVPYVVLPVFAGTLIEKLIYSSVITVISFVAGVGFKSVAYKKFKCKYQSGDIAAIALNVTVLSLGFINVFSQKAWESVAVFLLLVVCCVFKSPRAFAAAFVLPLSLALKSFSVAPVAVFEIYCVTALLLIKRSKLLTAIGQTVCCLAVIFFENSFKMGVMDYILTFLPVVCFLFTPQRALDALAEKICAFDEKDVVRETINDERRLLAAKLYSLSTVFSDLEKATEAGEKLIPALGEITQSACGSVISSVCGECEKYGQCFLKHSEKVSEGIFKMLEVGFNKGKVSLIDLPKDFSDGCRCVNAFLYEINKSVSEYGEFKEKCESAQKRRALISSESGGVGEILKNLSYEFSAKIDFERKTEKSVAEALALEGLVPDAVVSFGENEFHVLFSDKSADAKRALNALKSATGKNLMLSGKVDLGKGVMCVFKKSPSFDAAFGVAQRTKRGVSVSGDVHSLVKINEGKFMVALCDGMGSGENARESSGLAVELIESLSRAGLNPESVADLSNSLLSIKQSDGFSAADVAIIDLYAGICNIIKMGATFGLMLTNDGVKVLENSSLPLGVLNEVTPDSYVLDLKGGETLIMMSDGVTDAFFSSTDAVEFLETEKSGNPQVLAEKLLLEAVSRGGGEAKDDMTCLAVKIYKKDAA